MDVKKKYEDRGRAVQRMRDLQAKAKAESRDLTSEEAAEFDRCDKEQDSIRGEIDAYERGLARDKKLDAIAAENRTTSTDSGIRPTAAAPESRTIEGMTDSPEMRARATTGYNKAFSGYIRSGQFELPGEIRATLQVDSFTKGGALLAPIEFVDGLIKAVDDQVFIRQLATKHRMGAAQSLGAVSLDADPDDSDWTAELQAATETDITLGKRELHPHPLTKAVLAAVDLLNRVPKSEGIVRDRLAYKNGISQEKAFMTGDGNRKPLGAFTASTDGISTARDVSTGNTSTAIGGDGLIEAKHNLKAQYWARARWVFSRTAMTQIRKLKTVADGQYIWVPGLQAGVADRILDVPYLVSEYCPATFTASQYVGIIGDFSQYWIADALDMTITRLVELYRAQRKIGFISELACDGMPVLEEAFTRVKLSA
jgi:HK97 family phage major capsid protein